MAHPLAELATEESEGCEVGGCRTEHGAEETESPGGGAGDRATGPAASSGRRKGPEVTGGLAADEPDGHHQYAESKEDARGGRPVAKHIERGIVVLRFDG